MTNLCEITYFSSFTMILNHISVGLPWIVDARDIHCLIFQWKKSSLKKKHVHLFQAGVLQSSLEVDLDHYKLSCSWRCHSPPNLPAALQYKKVTKINMVDVLYNTSLSKRCNQPKFSIVTNKIWRWNEADFIHFHSASFETNKGKKKYF